MLKGFLYEAIFVLDGVEAPPKSIVDIPELQVYISGFGSDPHDMALIAEVENTVVGAVWVRIMNDYGHIDDETPSFAISLYKEYRGLGIGTEMIKAMLAILKDRGYKQASLAVQKANYAVEMYRKVGFEIINENDTDFLVENADERRCECWQMIREQCITRKVHFEFRQCGTHFIKDGKSYILSTRDLCSQARKANINY